MAHGLPRRTLTGVCLLAGMMFGGCPALTFAQTPAPFPRARSADPPGGPENGQATLSFADIDERQPLRAGSIQPAAAQQPLPLPRTLPVPGEEPGPAKAPVEAGGWTLSQALNQALVANPDLIALRGQINVNQAMVGVAKTYPWNPFVQGQFMPQGRPFVANAPGMPASGAGYTNYYIWVMQRFELAHQRRFRTQGAMAAMDQVRWNIFQNELLNVAQTSRLYFAALYQKEVWELTEETAVLNERLADIAERRFKANLAKAGDVMTAKVAARQTRRQAELAVAVYQASLLAVRQQMNLAADAPLAFAEKLGDFQWLHVYPGGGAGQPANAATNAASSLTQLAAELVEGRPDVLAAQAGVRVSTANFKLAKAAMIPDLQAGPIYETADDTTRYLGVRVQFNLPIFDTGAPLARQRRAELSQQELTYAQLKIRAGLEAQMAIDQYERVLQLAAKARPVRVDPASPELKEITRLFEAGQADILAVLTTQSNLLQEQRIYLDLLNQLTQTAANVIQATGLPPDHVLLISCPLPGASGQWSAGRKDHISTDK